ncbi:MAG: acetyl-CoA carboxylase biotin carboxylase subunit [Myxococcota bacterium]
MFGKILIANRGEIAVRVIRACRALGVRSVAIYSEADADALHVRMADEAHPCGPARATESYLDIPGIVGIAVRSGAEAVHPGYGFLSENADFAQAVEEAGLVFIGPSPEVIRAMGGKIAARERMRAAGVRVVPGGQRAIESLESARHEAEEFGYPVLVKASAGGGGRGMRRVNDEAELESALERAASEALAAFGDDTLYLEKYLSGPRHIEIQILADRHGKTLHLGERECSIQRRHQKLVEESPAFGMTDAVRAAMGEAAVRAAQSVGYVGAGTCEFMMDSTGAFYFLEMNTRIQVEHPVTEAVTGFDLVALQIRIAAGEPIPFEQADVKLRGHAIEARIYAEDPDTGFVPSPGRLLAWHAPEGPGIRLDSGFEAGQTVTPHYDAMLAKLIVHGSDRADALACLARALEDFWIAGVRTGLPFLRRLAANPGFAAGGYDTGFLEAEIARPGSTLAVPRTIAEETRVALLALAVWRSAVGESDPSHAPGGLEVIAAASARVTLAKQAPVEVEIGFTPDGAVDAPGVSASTEAVRPASRRLGQLRARIDGRSFELDVAAVDAPGLSDAEPVLFDVGCAGSTSRHSIVRKKNGDLEAGLRDQVVKLKLAKS